MNETKIKVGKRNSMNLNGHLLPLGIFLLGIFSCFISAIIAKEYWNFLGLLIIVSLASVVIGLFLGFLFGIPKLNKGYNPIDNYDKKNKYNPNTNLEDISDWVTKIIVGISLTQLINIPKYMESIANYILQNNECKFICDFARPIIISDIIYFLITGFIIGYFYTRLFLPNLLSLMEENKLLDAENNIWSKAEKREIVKNISKLSSLTEEEISILRKINDEKNKFMVHKAFSIDETAVINVLLKKGIIDVVQPGTSGSSGSSGYSSSFGYSGSSGYSGYYGSTIMIVNEEILKELKE